MVMDVAPVSRSAAVSDVASAPRAVGAQQNSEVPREQAVQEVKQAAASNTSQQNAQGSQRNNLDSGYVALPDNTLVFQIKRDDEVVDQWPNNQQLALRHALKEAEQARQKQQDSSSSIVA